MGLSAKGRGFMSLTDIFDPSKGWLHAGALRISMKVLVATDDEPTADQQSKSNPLQDLSKEWGSFFAEGEHTDVTIKAKDEQIQAHSVVLMARSSVFAAMLSSPMREGTERVISIADLDISVVKQLSDFCTLV